MNERKITDLESQLDKVTLRLENLLLNTQKESKQLTEEIEQLRDSLERAKIEQIDSAVNINRKLEVGSTVRIRDNYKGKQGIIGTVYRTDKTGYWYWLRDNKGDSHRKAGINLEVLKYDLEYYPNESIKWHGRDD